MITAASLREYTYRDLVKMAKKNSIRGWHAMRKDELVRALVRVRKNTGSNGSTRSNNAQSSRKTSATSARVPSATKQRSISNGKSNNGKAANVKANPKPGNQRILANEKARDLSQRFSSVSSSHKSRGIDKDSVIVMVRGPYWIHVYWQITRRSVERAQAAMAQEWHGASPYLRLYAVGDAAASNMAETLLREIAIHSGVNHWYIDLHDPPGNHRVDIGYRGADGRFYMVARSNVVITPSPGSCDVIDENWIEVAEDCERIFALSGGSDTCGKGLEIQEVLEERLRRPLGSPMVTRYGAGAERLLDRHQKFDCDVDCELIVFGSTEPDAYVTLKGEPVKLRPDGTFTVRLKLPNRRQVIPIVADSNDGLEQRTTVLAVERNTKEMEPVTRDPHE